jgi:hypothetical protein
MLLGRKKAQKKAIARWGGWLVGVAVVVWLIHRIGSAEVLATFIAVGPRLGWLALAYAVSTAVMAIPWRLLLPPAARPSLAATVSSRFAASGLNALLPLIGAGEVARLLWLPPPSRAQGAAALAADRIVFAGASVTTLVVGALATLSLSVRPEGLLLGAVAAAVAIAVLLALVLVLARDGKAFTRISRAAFRLWGAVGGNFGDGHQAADLAAEIDAHLKTLVRAPRRLGLLLLIHLVGRGLAAFEIYVALRLLQVPATPAHVLVLAAVPVASALVGAFLPGQIGLQEGVQAAVAAALGLGATAGIMVVLLQRARQLLFLPITAALLYLGPHATPLPLPGRDHHRQSDP